MRNWVVKKRKPDDYFPRIMAFLLEHKKEWLDVKTMNRELDISDCCLRKHLKALWLKHYIRMKPTYHNYRWKTYLYKLNNSKIKRLKKRSK